MKLYFKGLLLLLILSVAGKAQVTAIEWFDKGVKLNDSVKHNDAIKAFEKAILLDKKYVAAYYRLGWTYNELADYDKAIDKLSIAVGLKKDYAFALQELGYAYKKREKFTEALDYFNKAITIKPDYAVAYKQLGDVYMKLKRDTEGVAAYEKAYSFNNKNESACFELGYWYNSKNDFEKALLWLTRANAIKSTVSTYNEIGFANYKLQKNDEAITAYKNALSINPVNGTAYKGMGDVYRRNYKPAKTTEAMENYRIAIKNNPKSSGSYFGLGWCYNEKGFYDSSIISLKKALELENTLTAAYTELGYAQYMKGFYTDAITTFNKGLSIDAKSNLPRYYKGLVYTAQKDKTNAQLMYNELKPIDNSLAEKLLIKINAIK